MKITIHFLSCFVLLGLFIGTGCTSGKKELVTLKMIYPGTPSPRMKEFLNEEFNRKIEDELGIHLELTFIPWDLYFDKKDIMIEAGEQLDLYWDGYSHYNRSIAGDGVQPLNELLDRYGPDIKKVIPEENFIPFTRSNQILAIPAQYASSAEKFRSILVRQDLLEEAGLQRIATLEDFEQYAARTKARYPDLKVLSEDLLPALIRYYSAGEVILDTDIYIIAFDEQSRRAFCTYESQYFEKSSKKQREWTLKGWIPEEVTIKLKEHRIDSGNYLAMQGGIARPLDYTLSLQQKVPGGRLAEYLLLPDKPRYKWVASTELLFIPRTAVYPEKAMEFINWIYKSRDNYRFCLYGVEGKDWVLEKGRIKRLTADTLFWEWMFQNKNYMEFPDYMDDDFIETFTHWDDGALLSARFGFMFDSRPVHEIGLKLAAVYWEKILPISTGFIDYDENIEAALAALKEAGIDAYVAEYQRQFDEWSKAMER